MSRLKQRRLYDEAVKETADGFLCSVCESGADSGARIVHDPNCPLHGFVPDDDNCVGGGASGPRASDGTDVQECGGEPVAQPAADHLDAERSVDDAAPASPAPERAEDAEGDMVEAASVEAVPLCGRARLFPGDCRISLAGLATTEGETFDTVFTDAPYHLASIVKRFGNASLAHDTSTAARMNGKEDGLARMARRFVGKDWDDGDIAFRPETWRLAYDVLKPGGHLCAFGASRNFGFMQTAIAEAGFEVRDTMLWLYGSGQPKSHQASLDWEKTICTSRKVHDPKTDRKVTKWFYKNEPDREMQREAPFVHPLAQQWADWGTGLKPAAEFITLARKPFKGSLTKNLEAHGCGALNIGASMVGERWPSNVAHDGSAEIETMFSIFGPAGASSGIKSAGYVAVDHPGNAARFFYSSKATADDRLDSDHPSIKPINLLRYYLRMVTPPGGKVLDLFAGTGTTGVACLREGFAVTLMERDPEYIEDIRARFTRFAGLDTPLFSAP